RGVLLKIIELFAGVGSQTQALKNIGVEHEVVGIAEIDKYAISSYMQLHGETPLLGDITKIEKLPNADLWTYSFPCQDLSVAGLGKGIKAGTRSGLLYEVERLLENSTKPKYLLMENVKNLVGKKNKPDFDIWCEKLTELGYKNYWQVLNAKDYGVPQNRERIFMISILREHKEYIFPQKEELEIRLKDVLESEVEEKYYLKKEIQDRFLKFPDDRLNNSFIEILGTTAPNYNYEQQKQIMMSINIKEATVKGYKEAYVGDSVNLEQPNSETRRGRVGSQIANTLLTGCNQGVVENSFRIRRLMPLECWRLMGWKDEQFYKIENVSDTQLYKQAGNGIVVNVLEAIFKNMFNK
ncbi:MAG: DNA cytosine methyltransferase, partial [Cetobacterium sp.]